ncbi:MAG: hypothetical protein FRX48_09180 [Lasallia pustulata]|uniref:Uncharacterized protein n=1 Tax=Lasallia pustulata TaxID=136370 RepID=A0A5M8PDY8_9LECA|nr:MAG: hypothetical protein FRX48_09180 [Lasallia pustulata]
MRPSAYGGHVYPQAAWAAAQTAGRGFFVHSFTGYWLIQRAPNDLSSTLSRSFGTARQLTEHRSYGFCVVIRHIFFETDIETYPSHLVNHQHLEHIWAHTKWISKKSGSTCNLRASTHDRKPTGASDPMQQC